LKNKYLEKDYRIAGFKVDLAILEAKSSQMQTDFASVNSEDQTTSEAAQD
jgi:hypothetical protein